MQLGLRGAALVAFGKRELLEVVDMTDFVAAQRAHLADAGLRHLRMLWSASTFLPIHQLRDT